MTVRALLAGCLFAELAVAALLGVAVVVGRFDDAAQVGALLAAVAGVAALAGWRLSTGRLGRIATHGAL